jgi:hypothetical protein
MIGISLPAHFEIGPILYRSTRLMHCATSRKLAGSLSYALIGSWVDSSSQRNEYRGYLMTGKLRPVSWADSLTTFMCRFSRNSRSLNLLEP